MNSVFRSAARFALLCGASLVSAAVPAQDAAPALARGERAALAPLNDAVDARNYGAAQAALADARSRVTSPDGRYLLASLELQLGLGTNDRAMQAAAIDAMLASGAAPAAALPALYSNQGALALSAHAYPKAEAAFTRWTQLAPNDPQALLTLAEYDAPMKKYADAASLIDKAIDLRAATGQPVPESWYRRGLKHAFDGNMAGPSMKFGRELVAAYPTPENWRDVLLIYRDLNPADASARLDSLRLMRAAHALGGERDYLDYAAAAREAGLAAEAKTVLDEGVAAHMVDASKAPPKTAASPVRKGAAGKSGATVKKTSAPAGGPLAAGDAAYGRGEFGKAAELYRAAIAAGAADASAANLRLGMSLARAGQKADADLAFRAVTGPRADLASLWIVWLSRQA